MIQFTQYRKIAIKLLLIALCILAATAQAASIRLNDGTVISGQVIGFTNGKYRVRSAVLGTLSIDEYDIAAIDYSDSPTPSKASSQGPDQTSNKAPSKAPSKAPTTAANGAEIQRLQMELAGDADLLQAITSLQSDPQVQAVLSDPEIMRAVLSYDVNALLKNDKFTALLNNANVKAISNQALGND